MPAPSPAPPPAPSSQPQAPLTVGILCHPTYGGSGVVASELALSLADHGHDVHVFSHAVPPRLARSSGPVQMHQSQGLPYPLFASTPHDLAITSAVLTQHREKPFDILHAHYALPHTVSALLVRAAAERDRDHPAPKVVTTLHGTDITIVGTDPSYEALTQFLIASSDASTAVSESLARDTQEHFCMQSDPCRIEVIPNFVDADRYRPEAAGRAPGPPTAVHVSNFRPVKRVPWIVEAFAQATRGTEARLVLVGDGPDHRAARAAAAKHEVSQRVRFLGMRDELPELLAQADVFLLASKEESFGLSALEAMACGTPVVATAVGGVPEVVVHGETGLLVALDDPAAYVEALRSLLGDLPRARSMGVAARQDAIERFGRESVVARYEALYRRLGARA